MTEIERLEAEILGTGYGTSTVPEPEPERRTPSSRSRRRSSRSRRGNPFDAFLEAAGETLVKEITRGVFGNRRRR